MNIYDFDKTIYKGDSGVHFALFVFKKKPLMMIRHGISLVIPSIKFLFKRLSFDEYKGNAFAFVKKVDNLDNLILEYVNIYKDNVKEYYKTQRREDDLIVSASMDFYLLPLCKAMNINNVICTKYDINSCKLIGKNCHDKEKVKLVKNDPVYQNTLFENAYSDSLADIPLFTLAKKAYIVKGEKLVPYIVKKDKINE